MSKQSSAKDSLKNQQKLPAQEKRSEKQKTKEEDAIKKLKESSKVKDLYNQDSHGGANPKNKQVVNI